MDKKQFESLLPPCIVDNTHGLGLLDAKVVNREKTVRYKFPDNTGRFGTIGKNWDCIAKDLWAKLYAAGHVKTLSY